MRKDESEIIDTVDRIIKKIEAINPNLDDHKQGANTI